MRREKCFGFEMSAVFRWSEKCQENHRKSENLRRIVQFIEEKYGF
jgi:hypothetical protein